MILILIDSEIDYALYDDDVINAHLRLLYYENAMLVDNILFNAILFGFVHSISGISRSRQVSWFRGFVHETMKPDGFSIALK